MDLLDRLLGHDAWTTRQLLDLCANPTDDELDRQFDIGHRSLRATFTHVIHNMEVWSALLSEVPIRSETDQTIPGLIRRLDIAAARFGALARDIAARQAWDATWTDHLDNPPRQKSYGTAIAHLPTHSMHHRAQLLYLLRLSGVASLPEGDVFSWENRNRHANQC